MRVSKCALGANVSANNIGAVKLSTSARALGFTMIELLVVITIIAVMAGAVSLVASPSGPKKKLEQTARRMAAKLAFAADEAIFLGAEIGVAIDTTGYEFYLWEQPNALTDTAEVVDDLAQEEEGFANDTSGQTESLGDLSQSKGVQPGRWVAATQKEFQRQSFENIAISVELEGEVIDIEAAKTLAEKSKQETKVVSEERSLFDEDDEEESEEDSEALTPTFYILSSGEITPFVIEMMLLGGGSGVSGEGPVYRIHGDLLGNIRLQLPGEEDDEFDF